MEPCSSKQMFNGRIPTPPCSNIQDKVSQESESDCINPNLATQPLNPNFQKNNSKERLLRETYYLVTRFLEASPLSPALPSIIKELERSNLLPQRLAWTGDFYPMTYDEAKRAFSNVSSELLPQYLERLIQVMNETIPLDGGPSNSILTTGKRGLLRTQRSGESIDIYSGRDVFAPSERHPVLSTLRERNIIPSLMLLQSETRSRPLPLHYRITTKWYASKFKLLKLSLVHLAETYCVARDQSDKYIISASDDQLVKIFDAKNCRLLASLRGHLAPVGDISVDPDNTLLASCDIIGTVRVWSIQTGEPIFWARKIHKGSISSVKFAPFVIHPEKRWLFSAGSDGSLRIYPYVNRGGEVVFDQLNFDYIIDGRSHGNSSQNGLVCMVFSQGGFFMAVGGNNHSLRIIKLLDYRSSNDEVTDFKVNPKIVYEGKPHFERVDSLQFANNSSRLISGGKDGRVLIWSQNGSKWDFVELSCAVVTKPDPAPEKKFEINVLNWSCDDRFVFATLSKDYNNTRLVIIKMWESVSGNLVREIDDAHSQHVFIISPHPTLPELLLTAGHDGKILMWDVQSGKNVWSYNHSIPGQPDEMGLLDGCFSTNGDRFFITDQFGHMLIFGIGGGEDYRAEKVPDQLFFHNDYHPLKEIGDDFRIIDENIPIEPHTMQPPLLVYANGEPYPWIYQKLVPGRDSLSKEEAAILNNHWNEVRLHYEAIIQHNAQNMQAIQEAQVNLGVDGNAPNIPANLDNNVEVPVANEPPPPPPPPVLPQAYQRFNIMEPYSGKVRIYVSPLKEGARKKMFSDRDVLLRREVTEYRYNIIHLSNKSILGVREVIDVAQMAGRMRTRKVANLMRALGNDQAERNRTRSANIGQVRAVAAEQPYPELVESDSSDDPDWDLFMRGRRPRVANGEVPVRAESVETEISHETEGEEYNSSVSHEGDEGEVNSPQRRSRRTVRRRTRRTQRNEEFTDGDEISEEEQVQQERPKKRRARFEESDEDERSASGKEETDESGNSADRKDVAGPSSKMTNLASSKRGNKPNLCINDWFRKTVPTRSPYIPQFGDTVVYFRKLRASFEKEFNKVCDIGDKQKKVKNRLNEVEYLKVVGVVYDYEPVRGKRIKELGTGRLAVARLTMKKLDFQEECYATNKHSIILSTEKPNDTMSEDDSIAADVSCVLEHLKNEVLRISEDSCDEIYRNGPEEPCTSSQIVHNGFELSSQQAISSKKSVRRSQIHTASARKKPRKMYKVGDEFELWYTDIEGCEEFLLLKSDVHRGMSRTWKCGDNFKMDMEDKWWYGTVIQATNTENEMPAYKSLRIGWKVASSELELLSPWEVIPVADIKNVDDGADLSQEDRQEFASTESDWKFGRIETCQSIRSCLQVLHNYSTIEEFMDPVDVKVHTNYRDFVVHPMDINTIEKRLEFGYYRRVESVIYDAKLIATNCRLYNVSTSAIVKLADFVSRLICKCLGDYLTLESPDFPDLLCPSVYYDALYHEVGVDNFLHNDGNIIEAALSDNEEATTYNDSESSHETTSEPQRSRRNPRRETKRPRRFAQDIPSTSRSVVSNDVRRSVRCNQSTHVSAATPSEIVSRRSRLRNASPNKAHEYNTRTRAGNVAPQNFRELHEGPRLPREISRKNRRTRGQSIREAAEEHNLPSSSMRCTPLSKTKVSITRRRQTRNYKEDSDEIENSEDAIEESGNEIEESENESEASYNEIEELANNNEESDNEAEEFEEIESESPTSGEDLLLEDRSIADEVNEVMSSSVCRRSTRQRRKKVFF